MNSASPPAESTSSLPQINSRSPAAIADAGCLPSYPEALVVLRTLVGASPHRAALTPIMTDVERVAVINLQVREALLALAAQPSFAPAGLFRRPSAGERTIRAFLEYIAFASPAFLGTVGEWPLGQQRG